VDSYCVKWSVFVGDLAVDVEAIEEGALLEGDGRGGVGSGIRVIGVGRSGFRRTGVAVERSLLVREAV
jgi:hypothetical protein